MSLQIRYFVGPNSSTVLRVLQWDGVSLSDIQDFHQMWCTDIDNGIVEPYRYGAGPGSEQPYGTLHFYFLDQDNEPQGNICAPGNWIEVTPYNAEGPAIYQTVDGYSELSKPR